MRTVTKRTLLVAVALVLAWSVSVQAEPEHHRYVVIPHGYVYGPSFYDPWWSPYSPYWAYPYYPYAMIPPGAPHHSADLRVQVTPKQAEIYIDGYDAGAAGNFEGILKRLHTTPGAHAVTLRLNGYRTVTENIYVQPGSTFTLHESMDKLAAGETSAAPPAPARQK